MKGALVFFHLPFVYEHGMEPKIWVSWCYNMTPNYYIYIYDVYVVYTTILSLNN